ncbi:hypothetical protein ARMGADRAFT_1031935 [Armillaria gallica]|uniref:Uncharacterized protein n=1 Tax=Armillaria gallica TaxID=47427 RepID=A0A2H3DBU1_ARMGA|nr:hypothetical protein ARMGADRAFT_1031935 [Armillaria gallica]
MLGLTSRAEDVLGEDTADPIYARTEVGRRQGLFAAARTVSDLERNKVGYQGQWYTAKESSWSGHGNEGGTGSSTIWGQFLLRDLLITIGVLGPGGQHGIVHLSNLWSINGLVELSNFRKYGSWHGERAQRRCRVSLDGWRQKTRLSYRQITLPFSLYDSNFEDYRVTLHTAAPKRLSDSLTLQTVKQIRYDPSVSQTVLWRPKQAMVWCASTIFILIHHHPLLRNVVIRHNDQSIKNPDTRRDRLSVSTRVNSGRRHILGGLSPQDDRSLARVVGLDPASIQTAPSMTRILVERAKRRGRANLQGVLRSIMVRSTFE